MKALRAVNSYLAASLSAILIILLVCCFILSLHKIYNRTGFAWFIECPCLVSWLVFPLLGPLLKKGQHIKLIFNSCYQKKKNFIFNCKFSCSHISLFFLKQVLCNNNVFQFRSSYGN